MDQYRCFVPFISFVFVHIPSERFVYMQYAAVSVSWSRNRTRTAVEDCPICAASAFVAFNLANAFFILSEALCNGSNALEM